MGIVHGDIRSHNLLVTSFSPFKVKLCDFAQSLHFNQQSNNNGTTKADQHNNIAAVAVDASGSNKGVTGVDSGSTSWLVRGGLVRWQAPEVCRLRLDPKTTYTDKLHYPFKIDVYAFAMCMVELVTAQVPFHHIHDESFLMRIIVDGQRPALQPANMHNNNNANNNNNVNNNTNNNNHELNNIPHHHGKHQHLNAQPHQHHPNEFEQGNNNNNNIHIHNEALNNNDNASAMDMPTQLSDIIKACWEGDPPKRPTFSELLPLFEQLEIKGPQLEIKYQRT